MTRFTDALAVAQLRDFLAADEGGKLLVQVAGGDAVGPGAIAVGLDAQLGNRCLHIELGILEAGNGLGDTLDLNADLFQLVQVRAEDLHGDGCGNSAEHVADAVGEWSANDGEDTGNGLQPLADVREDFVAIPSLGFLVARKLAEIDIELGGGDRDDVVAAFGTAEAASDLADFRH